MSERTGQTEEKGERLQKVMARAGCGSRRACEELIRQGRVSVNGRPVTELGTRVSPADRVALDGRPLAPAATARYVILNKPSGHVTTASDPQGRPTVLDLVPGGARLFPVGRLDADSEGLLLLTNDGDLAYRLTHPRFGVEKEYRVLVAGHPTEATLRRLREGVELDARRTAPARVSLSSHEDADTWLCFVIHEGRKRQIRRMCEAVGLSVRRLIRARVGPLRLGRLRPGEFRSLAEQEVAELRQQSGADGDSLVIAIDGPAGSGKSTLGETIARRHRLLYLDTGAMYRAVALLALRQGLDPRDDAAVSRLAEQARIDIVPPTKADGRAYTVHLDGDDVTWELFRPAVGEIVSVVSAFPHVREVLVERQREIARHGRAVVVGRDIATVVLPDAPIKLYVDASPEVRAERRCAQLRARGGAPPFEQVLAEIRMRDKLDGERATAPLTVAPDAVLIDSGRMTMEEEVALVDELIQRYRAGEGHS